MNFINESFHSLFLRSLRTGGRGGAVIRTGGWGNPFSHCRTPIKGLPKRSRDHAFHPTSLRPWIHFVSLCVEWNGYKWLPLSQSTVETLMPFRGKKKEIPNKRKFS
ncbi:hypothetical protein CEXT_320901 [Caerostris extrusa]|uniref:Uncharacterized protein n=1 Tax=Caerostris extrusa TaxID=172846 RepID=A0AAV4V758_CAEEX|nr:hypothetical protein CEXT_320901 [Caerostris extrusa]